MRTAQLRNITAVRTGDTTAAGAENRTATGAAAAPAAGTDENTGPGVLRSAALADIPDPDYADVCVVAVPPDRRTHIPQDPAELARLIFDPASAPGMIKALFWLRQRAVALIGLAPSGPDVFAVGEVVAGEAIIATDEPHLDFRAGIAAADGLIVVTTVVRLHGWRGRLYFAPVRLLHPLVTRGMIAGAIRRM